MTVEREFKHALGELNTEYVETMGQIVRAAMLAGKSVGIDYQPGNGTRYEIVFTAARNFERIGPYAVPTGFGDNLDGVVVVSLLNFSRAHAFRLLDRDGGYLAPWYVEEKFGGDVRFADAVSLIALFAQIADDKRVLYGSNVPA